MVYTGMFLKFSPVLSLILFEIFHWKVLRICPIDVDKLLI
jgi:hypothetical protein